MNRMLGGEGSLKKIRFDMKVFKENWDIYNKKHNRNYRIYNDMFKSNVKRTSKAAIIDVISGCGLNLMKVLFDALIREIRENVTFKNC